MVTLLRILASVVAGLAGLFGLAILVMNCVLALRNLASHSHRYSLVPMVVPICVVVAGQATGVAFGWLSGLQVLGLAALAAVLDPGSAELLIWLVTGCKQRVRPKDAA